MVRRIKASGIAVSMTMALASCSTAAQLTDDAIQRASFGRIDATPFTDIIEVEKCRDRLARAVGFTHQSTAVMNGVHVTQVYHCKAERVVSRVNLKNLNGHPMQCVAQTEDQQVGAQMGPYGVAHFEYSYAEHASQTCFSIS